MRQGLGPVVLLATLALASAGCGDDAPSGDAEPSASPSASPSTSPSATTSPSVGSDVPEASGDLWQFDIAQVRVPEGWRVDDASFPGQKSAVHPRADAYFFFEVGEDVAVSVRGEPDPLEEMARSDRSGYPEPHRVRVLEEVELDGVAFYHLSGPGPYDFLESFGTSHEGQEVLLTFKFRPELPKAQRERVLDSVLPTFEWR